MFVLLQAAMQHTQQQDWLIRASSSFEAEQPLQIGSSQLSGGRHFVEAALLSPEGDGILEPKPASSGESRATVYRPETDVAFQSEHQRQPQIEGQRSGRTPRRKKARTKEPEIEEILVPRQTRRLRLEHTHIQKDENRLCELLGDFYKAARNPIFADELHKKKLVETAKAINQVRFQHGDNVDQLGQAWWSLCLQSVKPSASTPDQPPAQINPRYVLQSLRSMERVGAPPALIRFSHGHLAGKQIRIADVVKACKLYQGPPVSLDVTECPSYCLPLAQQLAYYREAAVEVYKQLGAASSKEETLASADRLRSLIDEHSSLQALVLWSNWRLAGRRTASTNLEIATPKTWQTVMEGLQLSQEQLERCRGLRARIRQDLLDAEIAKNCTYDIVDDMVSHTATTEHLSLQDNLNVFDTVAAAQKAEIKEELVELKATSSLMHGVLTPVQSAMVRAILYLLLYSDDSKMRSFADINRFFHSIIVDDQMSSWMESCCS